MLKLSLLIVLLSSSIGLCDESCGIYVSGKPTVQLVTTVVTDANHAEFATMTIATLDGSGNLIARHLEERVHLSTDMGRRIFSTADQKHSLIVFEKSHGDVLYGANISGDLVNVAPTLPARIGGLMGLSCPWH